MQPAQPRTTCLSVHAGYACGRSGACCSAGWPVPVEPAVLTTLDAALAAKRLRPAAAPSREATDCFVSAAADAPASVAATLALSDERECVFLGRSDGNRCVVHRDLGEAALPAACRHFPRVCRLESDLTTITLSHYCPTAARLLVEHGSTLAIVDAPGALVPVGPVEGLDTRGSLPPLLRPEVLMDREAYRAWERHAISVLDGRGGTVAGALSRLARDAERVRAWRPGDGSLGATLAGLDDPFAAPSDALGGPRTDGGDGAAPDATARRAVKLYGLVLDAVPEHVHGPTVLPAVELLEAERRWLPADATDLDGVARRYAAARAFGSWCAYQGCGLRTTVLAVIAATAVLRVELGRGAGRARRLIDGALLVEAVRAADLLIVHLADPQRLAHTLGFIESAASDQLETLAESCAWQA